MKNLALILCILVSPLSYASYHEGTGGDSSNGNSGSSSGGYGGGGGGGAAALIAVGALVYYMNRDTEEDETESSFVRRYKESNFRISVGSETRYNVNNQFNNFSSQIDFPHNNLQLNLTYKLN